MYTAIIHPSLTYAAVVWWPRGKLKTASRQLEHLQRLACLLITGALRTPPTKALEIIVDLLPLPIYIMQTAMLACLRLRAISGLMLTADIQEYILFWSNMPPYFA